MSDLDNLAQKWGAYGGDRKLSPRFPTPEEIEERMQRGRERSQCIAAALICSGVIITAACLILGK